METKIQKNVMRRVYYSYALSFLAQPMLWQGFVLGGSIVLFGQLTHVASIARNFAHTNVENTPAFIFNSFANALVGGEVLTVLVSVFMIGLSLSFVFKTASLISYTRAQVV